MKYEPQPVSAIDLAFPARGVEIAPPWEDIPEVFRRREHDLCELQADWFMFGLDKDLLGMLPAEGIDPSVAWDNLRVIQGCYGLRHEHKAAAVAFLASEWFVWIAWLPRHEREDKIRTWAPDPWDDGHFERPSDFTKAWIEEMKKHDAQEEATAAEAPAGGDEVPPVAHGGEEPR